MKRREGLVSNSSSSSFILATPAELPREELVDVLGIKKDSPIYSIVDGIIDFLLDANIQTEKEFLNDRFAANTWEEAEDELYEEDLLCKEAFQKGWIVRVGSASDYSSNGGEAALCHAEINYQSDNLILYTDGEY